MFYRNTHTKPAIANQCFGTATTMGTCYDTGSRIDTTRSYRILARVTVCDEPSTRVCLIQNHIPLQVC